jgi:Dihydroxyacid dehydratase/phosphogluconate dehydratase
LSNPIKATGHLQIMYGNLCPGVVLPRLQVKKERPLL